ncbi:MAG TPA: RNB domain-containing ribonuclease, partial [Pyrinomonadaceae bacterium]|nr:RNB domain-containing ribonuclease [Pyrinomonadaceae bacterium]
MSEKNQAEWLRERAYQTLLENGFEPRFSDAVAKQLDEIEGGERASEKVEDLRHLTWSSIDNRTSRDLDQVEWAERLENGDIRLLVGIADVDSLIPKGSPIDDHAGRNTVSVYTVGRVFPMLPEQISTDLTSLNEGADRLAVVADMTIKEDGDVPSSTFFRARVHNHAKLSYPEVGSWFDGGTEPEKFSRVSGLREQIELQREAALRLYAYRETKGALEF